MIAASVADVPVVFHASVHPLFPMLRIPVVPAMTDIIAVLSIYPVVGVSAFPGILCCCCYRCCSSIYAGVNISAVAGIL
jgi:hypothetical protein